MKIGIILNAKRTPEKLVNQLNNGSLSIKYNLTYDLFIKEPQDIASILQNLNHESYNAYLIGGGDGTVRTAAQILVNHDVPIAILPLGTFNMLAKSLNYPNDIELLFAMIKNNKTKQIDLGDVNDHIFINHSWIGFYYHILKLREKHQSGIKKTKLFKILFNAFNFFSTIPVYNVELKLDNQISQNKACLIYIGNNDHFTNLLDFGERKTLSSGLLSVSILNCQTRYELFKCMMSILINRFEHSKYLTRFSTDQLILNSQQKTIEIVLDGELLKLETPLFYTIHKKKLTVIIP